MKSYDMADAIRSVIIEQREDITALKSENAKLLKELEAEHALAETLGHYHEDAKAESAKLREDNDRLIQAIEDLHNVSLEDELVRLENENAKLRELVRTIYMCSCIQCDRCDYGYGDSCSFDAESELRELGVEVSE